MVAQQLTSYLQDNKLDETLQSSYKKHHSVETALLKESDIILAVHKGLVMVLVLLDVSAAFDTINHSMLLHRLESRFGVSGSALAWFVSYLSERYQCIRIESHLPSKTNTALY